MASARLDPGIVDQSLYRIRRQIHQAGYFKELGAADPIPTVRFQPQCQKAVPEFPATPVFPGLRQTQPGTVTNGGFMFRTR